jgi:hypothetical protein
MSLQTVQDWLDLALKVMSILAIALGGWWAYYQFDITETTASNVQLSVTSEYQKYNADSRLLVVHAKAKNIGKVLVEPGKDGFVVAVQRISTNLNQGPMELERLPLMYHVNILKRYPDGYALEPGVEYDEVVTFVVPKSSMYAIKATLDLGEETEVDQTTVSNVE